MSHAKNTEPHLESSVCGFLREPLAFWQFRMAAGTSDASRVKSIRDIERLSFATRDGRKLGGYKLRAENPQGYLLVAQGNAMLADQIMGTLAFFRDAGCGIVPFKYKDKNFVNALQWAIGLETFLLVDDPWRIFLTTDHPNGAPFTSYPHLIRLLMDKSFRNDVLSTIHPEAQKMTTLASIEREYSLQEIAIMTRAGAARLIGLQDRGGLSAGNWADITVYTDNVDRQLMFERPDYVFKDGELVVVDGKVIHSKWGTTHVVKPDYDASVEKDLQKYFDRFLTMKLGNFKISDDEITEDGRGSLTVHPLKGDVA